MRARVTHAVASGRRVVLTVAVPMDRTATADDVARVLRESISDGATSTREILGAIRRAELAIREGV